MYITTLNGGQKAWLCRASIPRGIREGGLKMKAARLRKLFWGYRARKEGEFFKKVNSQAIKWVEPDALSSAAKCWGLTLDGKEVAVWAPFATKWHILSDEANGHASGQCAYKQIKQTEAVLCNNEADGNATNLEETKASAIASFSEKIRRPDTEKASYYHKMNRSPRFPQNPKKKKRWGPSTPGSQTSLRG